ncbi:hypothetical protein BGZ60DRAFT_388432, partial [Tricladium varicosporioides]
VYNFWLEIVSEYSFLRLSKPRDRHYAIVGIVDIFSRIVKDKYIASIWEKDIARGLAWGSGTCSSPYYSRSPIVPTWSWISYICEDKGQFDSNINYARISINEFVWDKCLAISHSASGTYSSFGPYEGNVLNITAAVIPARISIDISKRKADCYCISVQQTI